MLFLAEENYEYLVKELGKKHPKWKIRKKKSTSQLMTKTRYERPQVNKRSDHRIVSYVEHEVDSSTHNYWSTWNEFEKTLHKKKNLNQPLWLFGLMTDINKKMNK